MVGGMIGGKIHFRVNWKWRTLLNLCAYSVKDPSTLTANQRFTRIYRACIRRHHLLNVVRLKNGIANHKNFFEDVEKSRQRFEKAKGYTGKEYEIFMKETEEWLELTFFPAISHWPTRIYTNKYHLNAAYPDSVHDYDPFGYYKPKPLFGTVPSAGPYFQEYPHAPDFFLLEDEKPVTFDPYLAQHLRKIQQSKEDDKNKLS
jgi:hypothetical protein